MYSPRHSLFRKTAIGLVVLFFVFQLLSPAFLFRHEAIAFADTEAGETAGLSFDITTNVTKTTTETTKEVKDTVLDRIFKGLMLSASIALRNAMVYMSQKLAEQMVNWMATGEWGQGAMFYEQAWGKFTDDIMNATVGKLLDNLRDTVWSETGFNICEPALPEVKIQIMLGIELPNIKDPGMIEQTQPDCSLTKFINNWEAFGDNVYSKYKQFEKDPGAMSIAFLQETTDMSMDIKYTDLGQFLTLDEEVKQAQVEEKTAQEAQRAEGDGIKAKTSMSGDTVKSPAVTGKAATEKEVVDAKDMQKSEMDSSKEVITEIPESMIAAFLGSFVSKAFSELIMKKLFDQGITSNPAAYKPKQYVFENQEQIEKEVAQAIQTQKVSYSSSTKEIELLTQFTSCPQDRQINNCVVDGDFAQAVRAADQDKPLSLKEAVESGKVNGNLPLIPATDGRNKESTCFEQGWCYSNLTKLRKARIIPIGWEIAASKIEEGETVTLKTAMDKFNGPLTGNPQDDRFYHLIDPEWILRAPKARCEAEVPGPILIGAGSDKRAETCADLKSCISQDESGKCKAWGYCAAEQNVFRFGGADCPGQFDSCRLLTNSGTGEEASLLLNTVDKTGCDPNSVGCKQYSVLRTGASYDWTDTSTLFLNKKVENSECSPNDEGCTRFIRTANGLGTSLLTNGGFEVFDGQLTISPLKDNNVGGWFANLAGTGDIELVSESFAGSAGLLLSSDSVYSDFITMVPKEYTRYFAISAKAKKKSAAATLTLSLVPTLNTFQAISMPEGKKDLAQAGVDTWETVYQVVELKPTATFAVGTVFALAKVQFMSASGDVVIDNVVLEEIEAPTVSAMHEYSDYATKNALYIKKAPDYFSCYNYSPTADTTDPTYGQPQTSDDAAASDKIKGCAGFAKLCTADQVGCEAYSVIDGDEKVNGITSFSDYCPQECNGYSTFKEDSSFLDRGYFPVYFIPQTAKQCTAEAVGCEEFTNMEDLAAGKEAKAYFSEMRLCAPLPEKVSECSNFYTWVAKEASGFQLQAYYLQDADADGAPDTSDAPDNFVCNKEIFEAQINPNCRAFYNDGGSVYYREYSKTITCSADCHPYRRTMQYATYDEDNDGVDEEPQERCESKKGTWKPNSAGSTTSGECIFMTIPSESKVCSAEVAGCKAYKGNQSGNEEFVFNAQFNSGSLPTQFETDGTIAIVTLPEGQVGLTNEIEIKNSLASFAEGEYVFSFWVKKAQAVAAEVWVKMAPFADDTDYKINQIPSITTTSEWSLHSYSFSISSDEAYTPFKISAGAGSHTFYIDNMQIKKVEDVQYVIKDSWQTPASCDKDLFDEDLDQAQVGCKAYQDRASNTHFLKSFSGLCQSDKVGCEALVDTKNSLSPFAKTQKEIVPDEVVCAAFPTTAPAKNYAFTGVTEVIGSGQTKQCKYQHIFNGIKVDLAVSMNNVCDIDLQSKMGATQDYAWNATTNVCEVENATTPADALIYLVNDEKFACKNTEKGCMAVGLPGYKIVTDNNGTPANLADDKQVQAIDPDGWATNFYKIDPDLFGSLNSPLCASYSQSCEEYKDSSDATYFFKDPKAKLCEWRKGAIGSEFKEAWFVKGAEKDTECGGPDYSVPHYNDGVKQLTRYFDPGYAGWAGLCPGEQDKCTAFVDPTDKSKNPIGRAYYYLNNEQIDKTCTSVSRKTGCLMFNDTGNTNLTVNAQASYDSPTGTQVAGTPAKPADSNSLIKVVRDRECGAWYDCKSSHWAWDPNLNKYMEVCDKMGVCTSLTNTSDSQKCASFKNGLVPNHGNILTENVEMASVYQDRAIGWESLDYSGYSVSSNAPLQFYDAYDISTDKNNPDFRLVNYDAYGKNLPVGMTSCEEDKNCDAFCEVEGGDKLDPDDKDDFIKHCRCLSGVCARANPKKIQTFSDSQAPACRAYPTTDAPFPAIAAEGQAFKNAKTIDSTYKIAVSNTVGETTSLVVTPNIKLSSKISDINDYGCFYSKFSYGGGAISKYFPLEFFDDALSFTGFCQDDHSLSCTCDPTPAGFDQATQAVTIKTKTTCSSTACGNGESVQGDKPLSTGICMRQGDTDKKVEKAYGWQGYCLERDKSITINNVPGQNPCLTWYPTDSMAGLQDIKNTIEAAGYNPAESVGNLFTMKAKGWNKDWSQPGSSCAATDDTCNSHTDNPYIKAVNSVSDCYDYGASSGPTKNWTMCFSTGGSDSQSYMEGYHDVVSATIYEDEIVGIIIKCDSKHTWSDWCDSENATMQLWYDSSIRYFKDTFPNATFNGFFIPKEVTSFYNGQVGPIFAPGTEADGEMRASMKTAAENNYVTSNGSLSKYKFYKNDGTEALTKEDIYPGYNGPWNGRDNGKAWTYWQAVWSDSATNTPKKQATTVDNGVVTYGGRGDGEERKRHVNRYYFGGDGKYLDANVKPLLSFNDTDGNPQQREFVVPYTWPWDYYEPGQGSKQIFLAPLFMATGYNNERHKCVNTLTKQMDIDSKVCNYTGGVVGSEPDANINAYKTETGTWTSNSPDSCTGAWVFKADGSYGWADTASGIAAGTPQGVPLCSNVQCSVDQNQPQFAEGEKIPDGQKFTNAACQTGWHCESAGGTNPNQGWCQHLTTTGGSVLGAGAGNVNYKINGGLEPIVLACDTSYAGGDYHHNNYFGIRIMFDETGKYRGLWQSICDDSGSWGGQSLEIDFVMKDYATVTVQANSVDASGSNNNAAFTQNIYAKAIVANEASKVRDTAGVPGGKIYVNSENAPMGSAYSSALGTTMKLIPDTFNSTTPELKPGGSNWVDMTVNQTPSVFGGKPWGCENGKTGLCDNKSEDSALNSLKTYFAKIFQKWEWKVTGATGNGEYETKWASPQDSTASMPDSLYHGSPIVAAVVPTETTDKEGNLVYGAVPGKITLNGKTEGLIEGFDGSLDASLKFYAWASDNQMPLRNVKVCWGDGTCANVNGKFKNHKPRCQRKKNEPLGLCWSQMYGTQDIFDTHDNNGDIYGYACNADVDCAHLPGGAVCENEGGMEEPRFGDASSVNLYAQGLGTVMACEEAYFNFNYLYECEKANVEGTTKWTTCTAGMKDKCVDTLNGKLVCRFKPKVQVKDNWGWVNEDAVWTTDGKTLTSMGEGTKADASANSYEFFDGYIYVHPGAE